MSDICGTTRILTADDRGVPLTAECPCGWTWNRPAGDDWADTLPNAARAHRAERGAT